MISHQSLLLSTTVLNDKVIKLIVGLRNGHGFTIQKTTMLYFNFHTCLNALNMRVEMLKTLGS